MSEEKAVTAVSLRERMVVELGVIEESLRQAELQYNGLVNQRGILKRMLEEQ